MTPDYDLAQLLPHRPPFLLVDRVRDVDLAAGRLTAERLVTAGDALALAGGSSSSLSSLLVLEALCQAAACLNGLERLGLAGGPAPHRGYLVSASGCEFPDLVRVGERLTLSVCREGRLGAMLSIQGEARAAAAPAASAAPAAPGTPGADIGAPTEGGRLIARGRLLFAVTPA